MDKMRFVKQKIALCLLLVLLPVWLIGCVRQHPVLGAEPTPGPTPSPTPPPLQQSVVAAVQQNDLSGNPIGDESTHYGNYVAFEDLRVYEYNMETFLDAAAVNHYPGQLTGAVEIRFYDQDGTLLAAAPLYTAGAETQLVLQPGENRIYAEINTDVNIQLADFQLETTIPFAPEETM